MNKPDGLASGKGPAKRISFEDLTPRQDSVARLLLLLAKPALTTDQKCEARLLAAEVSDWGEFVAVATRKFAVTFAYRHLKACAENLVPRAVLEEMAQHARIASIGVLRVAGAQVEFHRACIERTRARHAYLKGVALSLQYLSPLGERPCRDIDVLVDSRDFPKVVSAARSSGYRILLDPARMEFAESEQDFSFVSRHADVATLVRQGSVPIELHRWLDKLSLNFDLKHALATAEDVRLPGASVKVLSKSFHFVYLCYHHSRHFWSHLHWLADLDGILTSPDCDLAEIRRIASEIGIRPTIEAAIDLHSLVSRTGLWGGSVPVHTAGGQFLKACLINLDGKLDLEEELRKGMTLNDFMSAWQFDSKRQQRLWFNSWLRRLRPSLSQYSERKLPRFLEWLYPVQNVQTLLKNGLILALRGRQGKFGQLAPRRLPGMQDPDEEKRS
jgi:hypothetical protein